MFRRLIRAIRDALFILPLIALPVLAAPPSGSSTPASLGGPLTPINGPHTVTLDVVNDGSFSGTDACGYMWQGSWAWSNYEFDAVRILGVNPNAQVNCIFEEQFMPNPPPELNGNFVCTMNELVFDTGGIKDTGIEVDLTVLGDPEFFGLKDVLKLEEVRYAAPCGIGVGVSHPETVTTGRIRRDDTDWDGVLNVVDNCSDDANGPLLATGDCDNQEDGDLDGFGNACDTDTNNAGQTDIGDVSATLAQSKIGGTLLNYDFDCDGVITLPDVSKALSDSKVGKIPGPACDQPVGVPCP